MDAIDILGDLLGHKTSQRGRGADVLKDMFGRGSRRSSGSASPPKRPEEISREARELEDLLNVANDRSSHRRSGASPSNPQPAPPISPQRSSPASRPAQADRNQPSDDDRAIVLIRAMINAAKADGRIDDAEQKKIIDKLGNPSRANIDFLRKEFAAPLDVQAFIQSVPIGMEQQVYTMSLIAIDLDEGREANYLMQLAQGLRIPADIREQIHQRLGAPSVY
jgi:hypothetical protein